MKTILALVLLATLATLLAGSPAATIAVLLLAAAVFGIRAKAAFPGATMQDWTAPVAGGAAA